MKRKDLEKRLKSAGFYLHRHGAEHDIYTNGAKIVPVPRHREIDEDTAKGILKQAGLK